MLNYHCTACQKPHPYSAPAFCACGATTFTLIHSDDAGGASESGSTTAAGVDHASQARNFAAAIGAAVFGDDGPLQRHVFEKTRELVDNTPGGALPRDAPHVVGHGAAALVAPEAVDAELVDPKAHDVHYDGSPTPSEIKRFADAARSTLVRPCGQQGCPDPATHKFFWPEPGKRSTQYACEPHARSAETLGRTMGFSVDVEPLQD